MATANELLQAACTSGISCLSEKNLLVAIAQGASTGGGGSGSGGGTLSTDGTFAANSDLLYPSQKAAKTYIDTEVADALVTADSLYVKKAGDTMTGALLLPTGAVGAPSLSHTADANTGLWFPAADEISLSTSGVDRLHILSTGFTGIGIAVPLARLHITPSASGTDYFRIDHSDGTPRFQFGVTAADNTFAGIWPGNIVPGATNFSYLSDGSTTYINGPTTLALAVGGGTKWFLTSSGHFLASPDNTYDIGASGATRPRDIFVARDVTTGNAAAVIKTSVAMTSGAAAALGTLTNAPSAGDPDVWCPIMLNGVTHWFPCWT